MDLVDITKDAKIARRYKVERIPTMVVLARDKEVQRFTGITEESELRQTMNLAVKRLEAKARGEKSDRR